MGWTWGASAKITLDRYPQLANVPALLERWPALRAEVQERSGLTSPSVGGGFANPSVPPRNEDDNPS